jgi:hypothetical protein
MGKFQSEETTVNPAHILLAAIGVNYGWLPDTDPKPGKAARRKANKVARRSRKVNRGVK